MISAVTCQNNVKYNSTYLKFTTTMLFESEQGTNLYLHMQRSQVLKKRKKKDTDVLKTFNVVDPINQTMLVFNELY